MTKNVLILSGSPRKNGNTDVLCDRFAQGALDAGNNVEKIRICEKRIAYCSGCDGCVKTGRCVIKDDMTEISEKMIAADVIVLASPVYFYTIDAQMKTLIDRTVPMYRDLVGKEFYFIVAAADPNEASLDLTIECFRGFTRDCIEDVVEKGIIKAAGVWEKGAIDGTAYPEQAYNMGMSV